MFKLVAAYVHTCKCNSVYRYECLESLWIFQIHVVWMRLTNVGNWSLSNLSTRGFLAFIEGAIKSSFGGKSKRIQLSKSLALDMMLSEY